MASTVPNSEATQFRAGEEQVKIARQGGIASGKARKEKATMKATLEMLLNTTSKNGKTYRELATLGLLKGAINGNAQNYKTILALMGEMEEQQAETPTVNINIVNNEELEKYMYEDTEE